MSTQDEPDELSRADQNRADSDKADRLPDGAVQRFEAELASLAPRAVRLDRDRLMFLAGQRSASPLLVAPAHRGWPWPAAFSAMSALAAGLLLTLVLRSQPREVVRIVQVPAENVQAVNEPRAEGQNEPVSSPSEGVVAQSGPLRPEAVADIAADRTAQSRPYYVELRDRVLAMGLDGWPSDTAQPGEPGTGEDRHPESPPSYHDYLDSLLHGG